MIAILIFPVLIKIGCHTHTNAHRAYIYTREMATTTTLIHCCIWIENTAFTKIKYERYLYYSAQTKSLQKLYYRTDNGL